MINNFAWTPSVLYDKYLYDKQNWAFIVQKFVTLQANFRIKNGYKIHYEHFLGTWVNTAFFLARK